MAALQRCVSMLCSMWSMMVMASSSLLHGMSTRNSSRRAEDVVLAGDVREDVGDGLYEQVAARMAEGVVHLLEPVDVDEDDGVHRAGLQALVDKIT